MRSQLPQQKRNFLYLSRGVASSSSSIPLRELLPMRSHKEIGKVLLFYSILSVVLTLPLAFHLNDRLPSDLGDPLYNIWIMDHDVRGLKNGFRDFWNSNIFYPHQGTVTYADYLPALALLGLPVATLSHNLILTYNVLFIFSYILCAFSGYLLMLSLSRNQAAAVIAGIVFAFCPFRTAHISHLELLYAGWIALCFLFLHRFFDRPSYSNLAGIGFFFVLQVLSCAYYGVYFSLFIGLFILYFAYKKSFFKRKDFWLKMGLLGFCCFIILLPFFYQYPRIHEQMMFTRDILETKHYSAQLQHFLIVPPWNTVWGGLMGRPSSPEWQRYPGAVAICLALFWLVRRRRSRRAELKTEGTRLFFWWDILTGLYLLLLLQAGIGGGFTLRWGNVKILSFHALRNPLIILAISLAARIWLGVRRRGRDRPDISVPILSQRFFLFTFVLAWLLAMGPDIKLLDKKILTGPYLLLHEWVPVFQGLRAPSRMSMMMMLALALMAGWAVKALTERMKTRWVKIGVPLLAGLLIIVDYASVPIPLAKVPGIPDIYSHVRTLPADAVLIELPMPQTPTERGREALLMYYSIFHRKTLVNGYSGYHPPAYIIVAESMEDFPSPQTFRLLRDLGVDVILVHTQGFRPEKGLEIQSRMGSYREQAELKASAEGDFLYQLLPVEKEKAPERHLVEVGDRQLWTALASFDVIRTKLAFDGDPLTGWSTWPPQSEGDFFYLDLGKSARVGEIDLSLLGKPLDHPRGFIVHGSLDQEDWVLLKDVPFFVPRITRQNVQDWGEYRVVVNFDVQEVRYLMIMLTRSHPIYHWSIQELRCRGWP